MIVNDPDSICIKNPSNLPCNKKDTSASPFPTDRVQVADGGEHADPAVLQFHRPSSVKVLLGAVATAVASDGLGGDGEPVNVNEAIGKP
jgi:hypothetical protein